VAARPAHADELWVFAATSTAAPLEQLAKEFQAQSGTPVRFAFGASSDLARQLIAGARADVFLSADLARMDSLERAGLVRAAERHRLLSNQLAVVVPAASTARVDAARDMAGFKRLAIADPLTVPLGVYARGWLEKAGVWSAVAPNVIPTLDARAALAAVEAGNADAGIVYRTDARLSKRVRVAYRVPKADAPDIVYPIATLASSKHSGAAAFVEFLRSARATAVFEQFGFGRAP
jgi:molybdate transport system substrate-binding protein